MVEAAVVAQPRNLLSQVILDVVEVFVGFIEFLVRVAEDVFHFCDAAAHEDREGSAVLTPGEHQDVARGLHEGDSPARFSALLAWLADFSTSISRTSCPRTATPMSVVS